MTPNELVERWVDCFNTGDVDTLAALYHEDAVNHQVAETPVHGRPAIRVMFSQEFASADMTCIPEVIHEAGDVAILEWRDRSGCGVADSSRFATAASHSSAGTGTSSRSYD